MVMTSRSISSSSVVNTDLPKWQPILLNTNTINNNINIHGSDATSSRLIFGLTPPTVALIALAIFLCILVEILSKKLPPTSSSSLSIDLDTTVIDHHHRKQPIITMKKHWNISTDQPAAATTTSNNSKVSNKKKAFFSQMLGFEMICSFVLKGVLDFEKAAVEGNL